jgi:hypothetical protein
LVGQELREGFEVLTEPGDELPSVDAAGRQVQHDAFLLIRAGSISAPFSTRNVSIAAWPTRLLPSTKGWFPTSEKQSAAAFSASVG